jgi:hypothetical protein
MRYQTPAERRFEEKLEVALIARRERRAQRARERRARLRLGAR